MVKGWRVLATTESAIAALVRKAAVYIRDPRPALWESFAIQEKQLLNRLPKVLFWLEELDEASWVLSGGPKEAFEEVCPLRKVNDKSLTPKWNENL